MIIFNLYTTNLVKKIHLTVVFFGLGILLNSCGIWDPKPVSEVPVNAEERARKALEEGKGVTLGGMLNNKGGTSFEFASSNVMWRASLEILDFLPLANVDYSGGIISTDWYNEGTSNNESIKITIRFLSNEIRADGLKVIVHKKACNTMQNCTVKKIASVLEQELKGAILREATILEKALTDKKVKEYRKKKRKKE